MTSRRTTQTTPSLTFWESSQGSISIVSILTHSLDTSSSPPGDPHTQNGAHLSDVSGTFTCHSYWWRYTGYTFDPDAKLRQYQTLRPSSAVLLPVYNTPFLHKHD